MTHDQFDYARIIRQKGHRLTPQRKLVLDAVCAGNGHTTIEEVFHRAQARDPGIALATIYRNLDFLCELHLVVAATIGAGRPVYEIAGLQPHHHLVCRTCGKTERINQSELEQLVNQVQQGHGFRIDMDHLALFGECGECQQAHGQED